MYVVFQTTLPVTRWMAPTQGPGVPPTETTHTMRSVDIEEQFDNPFLIYTHERFGCKD